IIMVLLGYKPRASGQPDTAGFSTGEVERETPGLNNDKTFDSFEKETVTKYSRAMPGGKFGDWELLQKFPEKDSWPPNGSAPVAKNVTPDLLAALRPLAEEYSYDYFEFERTGDIVSVYSNAIGKGKLKKLMEKIRQLDL